MPGEDTPTVLIADDDAAIVDGQAARLTDEYRVRRAYGGQEALTQVGEEVDVALLERRMPDLSGDEVLDRIRTRGLDCRVAMLTGVEPSFDIASMGFDDYLRKPVAEAALLDCVETMLTRRSYDTTLQEFYSVARRIALLETEVDAATLATDAAYAELLDRRETLRDRLDETLDDLHEYDGYAVAMEDESLATGRAQADGGDRVR